MNHLKSASLQRSLRDYSFKTDQSWLSYLGRSVGKMTCRRLPKSKLRDTLSTRSTLLATSTAHSAKLRSRRGKRSLVHIWLPSICQLQETNQQLKKLAELRLQIVACLLVDVKGLILWSKFKQNASRIKTCEDTKPRQGTGLASSFWLLEPGTFR